MTGPGAERVVGASGRVVMLVDNGVEGDSRVQKAARSAAGAGWDVTLLGCAAPGGERSWRLGRAEVRLVPFGRPAQTPAKGIKDRLLARGGLTLRAARLARRPIEVAQVRYWHARLGTRAWRRLEPGLMNYERAFGAVIDSLKPDLIHAHDFRMLGVGARAVERARAAGRSVKLVWDVHEYLPGAPPRRDNARWLPAHLAYEREYAPAADAIITVSETLADLLVEEHRLSRRPAVVLNAPARADLTAATPAPDLRERCGLDARTPLVVYAGAAGAQRGLAVAVSALSALPDVHLALVLPDPAAPQVAELRALAVRRGTAARLHVLPYVPHGQVSAFLAGADAGLIPVNRWPNHEIALVTKFFEYSHARLPIVVSDVRTMAATVRQTGQGEVFRAGDAADLARAVRVVLADGARYRAAYDGPRSPLDAWVWENQAVVLDAIYRELMPVTA